MCFGGWWFCSPYCKHQHWERAVAAEPVNGRKYSKIAQNLSCLTTLTGTPTRPSHLWPRPRTAPAAFMKVRIWSTASVALNDSQSHPSRDHQMCSTVPSNPIIQAQVPNTNTPKLCNGSVPTIATTDTTTTNQQINL